MSTAYILTVKGISKYGQRLGWHATFKNMNGTEVDRFFLPTHKDLYKLKFQHNKIGEHVVEMCNAMNYIPGNDLSRWKEFCEVTAENALTPC